jgi:hypothetical protein
VSAETYAALEDAIRAHVADEAHDGHGLLTDWYLLTASVSGQTMDTTDYLHICSDMPTHSALGLVTIAFRRLNHLSETDD